MPSRALHIGNDGEANPGFVQQGQVDWVAFGKSTMSASISVMQRFSAAGVQPVTVAGGLALGSRFELGKKGAQNMDVALKNLSGVFGYDKILYYGFGYRSFVNILTETKVGVNLVALCACLVEMHGVRISAEILAALWKLEAFPERFEPAISQFNALVTACAGVVADTTFGQVGDIMLGDIRKLMPGKSIKGGFAPGSISNAEDIAKALHGLFQISRNSLEYIEVVGGANCSFIGAFAHWLLDLTVHVEDEVGTGIYQNSSNYETVQLRIRYRSLDQVSTELHIASRTYVLGNHHEMLFHTLIQMICLCSSGHPGIAALSEYSGTLCGDSRACLESWESSLGVQRESLLRWRKGKLTWENFRAQTSQNSSTAPTVMGSSKASETSSQSLIVWMVSR